MIRRISIALFALLLPLPLAAQAPEGYMMRVDRSTNAADPDDVPDVTLTTVGEGLRVSVGPAVVFWRPEDTATGTYTLSATFTLEELPGHVNYYGLVFGGSDIEGPQQSYLYFLVAQNGSYIVNYRDGEDSGSIQGRTAHDAVVPYEDGPSVNELGVRVGADDVGFAVNGTVVYTAAKTGRMENTDGIWGVRVNHTISSVLVESLGVMD